MAYRKSNYESMPSMDNSDPDELFTCPYDNVHRVAAKRFPYHLQKCRRNYLGSDKSTCPFNARHIVPTPEYRHHVANCKDRSTIEQDMAFAQTQQGTDGSYLKGNTSVPSYHHDFEPTSSENWDVDVNDDRRYRETEQLEAHSLDRMNTAQQREFNRKLLAASNMRDSSNGMDADEPPQPAQQQEQGVRRPKQLPRAAIMSDQRNHSVQNGVLSSVGNSVPCGPIGLGRAMLMPNQNAMPRPGTTVQGGRAIAANIFNSQESRQDSSSESSLPRRTPTVAMAQTSSTLSAPVVAPVQTQYSNPPPSTLPSLSGLGRGMGLGLPRGGYRPGLGMPAVGRQSGIQTNDIAAPSK